MREENPKQNLIVVFFVVGFGRSSEFVAKIGLDQTGRQDYHHVVGESNSPI